MTKIANTTKPAKYSIEINGFRQATCQSVEIGEIEITKDEHYDGNKIKKTPGKVKIPDLVIEKLVEANTSDPFFWDWFKQAQNTSTGNGEISSVLNKTFFIHHHNPNGTIRQTFLISDAWVCKMKPAKLGDKEEGNYIETVTLSVDDIDVVKS